MWKSEPTKCCLIDKDKSARCIFFSSSRFPFRMCARVRTHSFNVCVARLELHYCSNYTPRWEQALTFRIECHLHFYSMRRLADERQNQKNFYWRKWPERNDWKKKNHMFIFSWIETFNDTTYLLTYFEYAVKLCWFAHYGKMHRI